MTDETIEPRVPREMRTPITCAMETLSALTDIYAEWLPEKPENAFLVEFFGPMVDDETTSGDEAENRLFAMADSIPKKETFPALFYALSVSCAYCVQAMRADKTRQRKLAWTFVTDANYWLGIVRGTVTEREEHGNPLLEQARRAAFARHAENRQMKSEAIEWFEKNKGQFKSKDAAAEAIAGKVAPVTFRTARNWLKTPPKK